MKKPRVYVDTSVIGGCLDPEFSVWSNALLKDFELGFAKPVLSDLVTGELERAPPAVRDKLTELMACSPEIVEVNEETRQLARLYLARGVVPPSFSADAVHVACAMIAEVDILVSWNYKHIVHWDKMRLFNAVGIEMGYRPIQILTPREVTFHDV